MQGASEPLAAICGRQRDCVCVRCEQVDDLVRVVAELKEEVEKLRAIRECERETEWWATPCGA